MEVGERTVYLNQCELDSDENCLDLCDNHVIHLEVPDEFFGSGLEKVVVLLGGVNPVTMLCYSSKLPAKHLLDRRLILAL